jgi:hypothetical protein
MEEMLKTTVRLFLVVMAMFLLGGYVLQAQIPVKLIMSPKWTQPTVLTSRLLTPNTQNTFPNDNGNDIYEPVDVTTPADDEVNYSTIEFWLTTNVEFWTMQLNCTVPPTLYTLYSHDSTGLTTDNTGDNTAPFFLGIEWGSLSNVVAPPTTFIPATGNFVQTVALRNGAEPLGSVGVDTTMMVAEVNLRVRPQLVAPANTNSTTFVGSGTLTCTTTLLDRNGRTVGVVTFVPPTPQVITAGYAIRGNTSIQGQTSNAGITVQCSPVSNNAATTTTQTTATGDWVVNGLRTDGFYNCSQWANRVDTAIGFAPEPYLRNNTQVLVRDGDTRILPTVLWAGNVERALSPTSISTQDISLVTANFGTTVTTPFTAGDVNGDRLVDRVDLTLVASNTGLSEGTGTITGLPTDHFVVSGQRGPSPTLFNSRIYLNDTSYLSSQLDLRQYLVGATQDYWGTVSPDGTKIAFVRAIGTGAALRYVLHVAPLTGNAVGAPVRITPPTGWNFNDFAPSWDTTSSQLAFVCTSTDPAVFNFNRGNLCLVDASGKNLRQATTDIKIFPPAWLYLNGVVVAGTSTNAICPNSLCTILVDTGTVRLIDVDFTGGGSQAGTEDMPISVSFGALVYRYDADNNSLNGNELRYATPNFSGTGTPTNPFIAHTNTPVAGPLATTDYHLTVFTGNFDYILPEDNTENVFVQTFTVNGGVMRTSNSLNLLVLSNRTNFLAGTAAPTWGIQLLSYTFRGIQNNPTWDGVSATNLHALRWTVDWTP